MTNNLTDEELNTIRDRVRLLNFADPASPTISMCATLLDEVERLRQERERFDEKTDLMVFYAFRYCLGRMTSAVCECADYLIAHWERLSPDSRIRIHSEIRKAFERNEYGQECDYEDWQRVLNMSLSEPPTTQSDS